MINAVWRANQIQQLYNEFYDQKSYTHDQFLRLVADRLSITLQAAYAATDHLFRPENYN